MKSLAENAKAYAEEIKPRGYDTRVVDLERVTALRYGEPALLGAILHILNEMSAENARVAERVAALERDARHGKKR